MTWFDEQLHSAHRQGLKVDAVLYDSETAHHIQVGQRSCGLFGVVAS